jgi:DNA-binding NarL/FixJ family response regulator
MRALNIESSETLNDRTIKVFIVGDSHIMRSGLRRIVEAQAGIRVGGEASVKRAYADNILRPRPDLVLVDLDPRSADVLELIGTLHDAPQNLPVLVMSELADHELARKALAVGASGLVLKMQPPAVLIAAIRELCPDYREDSPGKTGALGDTQTATRLIKPSDVSNSIARIESLTAREREIIRLIGLGLKNKEIANRLSISDITVRHHLTSIFCKLEVADRQNLLILAHRYGLADFNVSPKAI